MEFCISAGNDLPFHSLIVTVMFAQIRKQVTRMYSQEIHIYASVR